MKVTKKMAVILAVVINVSILALTAQAADQPRMFAAREDLENAMKYLKKATADKGGHRQNAMNLVSDAISSVNKGIEYDRNNYTPGRRRTNEFAETNFVPVIAFGDQPNMEKARSYLNSALGNLNRASADKGGYREQALRQVRDAIAEVNAGIEYDRTH